MTFSRSVATLIPWGRVVNGFIITLIFLNAIAFAADTVPELAALQTLGRVLADEYRALLVVLILLLFASAGMFLLERDVQPDKFGSIPEAAWWALSTLTTVEYGDVVPITPLGKVLGGVVMLLGVGMIALPVAFIATGFNQ